MNVARRIIAVVGAPALLAGVMLAGSAAARPSVSASPLSDTVTYTATVITAGDHFTINSTSCRLHDAGTSGSIPCRVSGAGTLDAQGQPQTADVAITSADGPISLHIVNNYGCGTGTGIEIDRTGPTPVTAEALVSSSTNTSANMLVVKGTFKVYDGTHNVCRAL
ncbi:MAG: hypothetical protein QOF20_2095 [Acidimicrobiaceae bacterium]|jgi:hypothetical protein|nr:hypothetical protein [Acidimicrobiaceae bacterium]MDQ1365581.1 hypothetical protein [Acidimicrobiaceae bacterium]MDQ1369742.1 hypothetical protein [Acidimicrobiaceae bacterium]MDQ1377094.1 hypothetical protein [Acidimicrobiaceae bacterium]MDQ1400301.1 hypothetical protein [Acidimicrobiaceae bacterium]